MTTTDAITTAVDLAWQKFQAEERQARSEYLASVHEANTQFIADIAPAMDTYHNVERAAWQHYNLTSRAAKRAYLDATTAAASAPGTAPAPSPAPAADPPDSPDRGPWVQRPVFHPFNEKRF